MPPRPPRSPGPPKGPRPPAGGSRRPARPGARGDSPERGEDRRGGRSSEGRPERGGASEAPRGGRGRAAPPGGRSGAAQRDKPFGDAKRPARPGFRRDADAAPEAPRGGRGRRVAPAERGAAPVRERPARDGQRPARPSTRRDAAPASTAPRVARPPRTAERPKPAPASQATPEAEAEVAAEAPAPRPHTPSREPQRIAKLLARAGIASRREIERMIEDRRIALDGVPLETPATLLTSLAGVTVDGKAVGAPAPARLFLFHKPPGVLTAERDFSGRPTIYDKLPKDLPRVIPVGRLDLNTEGLLLLTTDGELKRQLELPSSKVERTYRARAFGDVTQEQLEELITGVEIEGIRYGAIDANMERRTGRNVWIEMRLTEGKNREVRRVLEYLGLQVSRLIRTAYGPFQLGDIPVGGLNEIHQHDLADFRKTLK
ncbi:MAG TPA: pseudouridine synthase [Allosphingosinicella sp.]